MYEIRIILLNILVKLGFEEHRKCRQALLKSYFSRLDAESRFV